MKVNGLIRSIAALALLGMVPAGAEAQQSPWHVSVGAGPSLPLSELADETDTGFHVIGSLEFTSGALPFDIRTDIFYQNFHAVERDPSIHRSLGGEWYRQLSASVNAKYGVPVGSLQLYALVGGGWTRDWHDDRTYWTDSQQGVQLNAGVGVNFRLLSRGGFIEVRNLNVFGGDALPTRAPAVHPEVRFRSVPITLGLRF